VASWLRAVLNQGHNQRLDTDQGEDTLWTSEGLYGVMWVATVQGPNIGRPRR